MKLEDYNAFHGRHWETGSVCNYWDYHGVTAPPISEALLMGISGGAVIGYFTFAYKGYDPHVALLTRNTFDPLDTLLSRLGVEQHTLHTTSEARARANLLHTLEEGLPPLVWADMYTLPYNTLDARGMWQMAPVVVFGVTDDAVHIADRSSQPLRVPPEVFHAARAKVKKTKFRVMTLSPPQPEKLAYAVRMGISDALKIAHERPPKGSAKNFGIRGLQKWHTQIRKGRWMDTFKPGRAYLHGLLTAYEGIKGDGERWMYATFLDEAARILKQPELREAADAFRATIPAWQALGKALLPDDTPILKNLRMLSDTHHRLFIEQGQAALDEIQAAKEQIEAIKAGAFPLESTADHLEGIASALRALIQVEGKAWRILQERH